METRYHILGFTEVAVLLLCIFLGSVSSRNKAKGESASGLGNLDKFPHVEVYENYAFSTRAFHLGWEELPSATMVKDGDLLSHTCPYSDTPYERLFFFSQKGNDSFWIEKFGKKSAKIYRGKALYGYSLYGAKSLPEASSTVCYLEITSKYPEEDIKAICSLFPNVRILSFERTSNLEVSELRQWTELLQLEYVYFAQYTFDNQILAPINSSDVSQNLDLYRTLYDENTLKYITLRVEDVNTGKTQNISGRLKGVLFNGDTEFIQPGEFKAENYRKVIQSPSVETVIIEDLISFIMMNTSTRDLEEMLKGSKLRSLFISGDMINKEDFQRPENNVWSKYTIPGLIHCHETQYLYSNSNFDLSFLPSSLEYFGIGACIATRCTAILPKLRYYNSNYAYFDYPFSGLGYRHRFDTEIFLCKDAEDFSAMPNLEYAEVRILQRETLEKGLPTALKTLRVVYTVECVNELTCSISALPNLEELHLGRVYTDTLTFEKSNTSTSLKRLSLHQVRYSDSGQRAVKNEPRAFSRVLLNLLPKTKLDELDLTDGLETIPESLLTQFNTKRLYFLMPEREIPKAIREKMPYEIISRSITVEEGHKDWEFFNKTLKPMYVEYQFGDPTSRFFLRHVFWNEG